MLRLGFFGFVTSALLGAAACGGGSLATPDGATSVDSTAATFPCGAFACVQERQYCFAEQWNGVTKTAPECRPLPAGCSACACASPDAASISMSDGCRMGVFTCTDGVGVIDPQTSSPTLNVLCDVA